MLTKVLPLLLIPALLSSCGTSPTGRSQLLMMSDSEMEQMGEQSFVTLKKDMPIEQDAKINAYVRCVATAITNEVGGDWEVVVFKEPSANAFALPGRKIGVHTGLLTVAQNQDQLAAVLGHEVAHVLANHGNERVSQKTAVSQGLSITQAVLNPQSELGQTGMGLLGIGAEYGIIMPFSRAHESEADIYGLDLMAKAGFNPQESVTLWVNMGKAGGETPPEFMSTHPAHETRITDLQKQMPKALKLRQEAQAKGKNPKCK
ncbi:M48 family metallopeptidase [Bathymodiolus platifrons methanotrophic gill symbiont]|uniref:M48 family metallopeptidase n=2 Tax=Bathymodiolus platifrons methanotrophic gill symbiont TaxID=113268 RepID=UPI000B40D1D9|nr:M48 family metallopeptidase [Bathymodiolus platifrons methanotrophic gill symbiont]